MLTVHRIRHIMIAIGAWLCLSTTSLASTSTQQADADLVELEMKAMEHVHQDNGLTYIDQLYELSKKRRDMDGLCLALQLKIEYYFLRHNDKAYYDLCDELAALARNTNWSDYYYYSKSMQIMYLINNYHLTQVREAIDNVLKEAREEGSSFGETAMLQSLSIFYYKIYDYRKGEEYQLKSLTTVYSDTVGDARITAYYNIAESAIMQGDYRKALSYADKAVAENVGNMDFTDGVAVRCKALFFLGRDAEFRQCYERYAEAAAMNRYESDTPQRDAYLCHLILEGDTAKARRMLGHYTIKPTRYLMEIAMAQRAGNWQEAYRKRLEWKHHNDSIFGVIVQTDFRDVNTRLGNYKLAEENNALQMEQSQTRMWWLTVTLTVLCMAVMVLIVIVYKRHRYQQQLQQAYSDTQQALAQAEQARRQAEDAAAAKTLFLQTITHEFRTPLNSAQGFAQLLGEEELAFTDDEKTEFLQNIDRSAQDMMRMIGNIDYLARHEGRVADGGTETLSVNRLCADILHNMEQQCADGVRMVYTTSLPDNLTITSSVGSLGMLLTHLLQNAMKYTEQGSITLEARMDEAANTLVLCVTDTGRGVPKELAESVFERFEKLGSLVPGLGLGLSICRDIAQRLGGTIALDTSYTAGARFEVRLPNALHV